MLFVFLIFFYNILNLFFKRCTEVVLLIITGLFAVLIVEGEDWGVRLHDMLWQERERRIEAAIYLLFYSFIFGAISCEMEDL